MRRTSLASGLALTALLLSASSARAGGLEYQGQGATALGRAGAVEAKASDPMVIAYNPAGLAELRGSQFLLNLNLALFHACDTHAQEVSPSEQDLANESSVDSAGIQCLDIGRSER